MKVSKMKLCAFGLAGLLVAMGIFISADIAFAGTVTAKAENDDQTLLNQIEDEIINQQNNDDEASDNPDTNDENGDQDITPTENSDVYENEDGPVTSSDSDSSDSDLNSDGQDPIPDPEDPSSEDPETPPTDINENPGENTNQPEGVPEHVHQYNYTDNGDGTHTKWCADTECGSSEIMEHSYKEEDHLCECGAKDPVYADQEQTNGDKMDDPNPDSPVEPEKTFEFSEDQYNSMNTEIDTLNKEISNLNNQLDNYKNSLGKTTSSTGNNNSSAISSLNSQVSSLQSKNTAMQNSVSSLSNANTTLQNKNNTLTSEIANLKSQITALNNQLNNLKNNNSAPAQPVVRNAAANTSSTVNNQRSEEGFQDTKAASVTNIQNLVETTTDTASVPEENTVETFDMSLNTLSDDIYFDFSDNEEPEELVSTSQSTSTVKYQSGAESTGLAKNTLSRKRMRDNQTIMVAGCVAGFATLMFIVLMVFGFKSGVLSTKKNKSLELEDDESGRQSDTEQSSTEGTGTPINAESILVAESAV